MNSKKWVANFFVLIFISYPILWGFVYVVNPTYKYDNRIIKKNKIGYSSNANFSRTLFTKLKEGGYTLVFGTSRSHLIDEGMLHQDTLNLHSIYGHPDSIYSFLNQLDKNQINNIGNIFYLVDTHTVNIKEVYIDYNLMDFDLSTSASVTRNDIQMSFKSLFSNSFITLNGSPAGIDKSRASKIYRTAKPPLQEYSTQGIEMIKKINQLCIQKGINITYITPTFPNEILNKMNLDLEREKWLKLLNGGIEEFYALYWVDNISNLKQNGYYSSFYDETHINYNALDGIMNDIVGKNNIHKINNSKDLDYYFNYIEGQLSLND